MSFTYAVRYYLQGKIRPDYFDKVHAKLVVELERLSLLTDNISLYNAMDQNPDTKEYFLGPKFLAEKENLNGMKSELVRNFTEIMTKIKTNFRDLDLTQDEQEDIKNYAWMGKWQCQKCTYVNPNKETRCLTCDELK